MKQYNIAVAGTGYVGLSIATLLAQHNHVTAVDIIPQGVYLVLIFNKLQIWYHISITSQYFNSSTLPTTD